MTHWPRKTLTKKWFITIVTCAGNTLNKYRVDKIVLWLSLTNQYFEFETAGPNADLTEK